MSALTLTGSFQPLTQGFLVCASMIIALGPQNLFILRQGLRRQHMFVTALFSTLADVVLITLGVGGLGSMISANENFQVTITFIGILFLLWCGSRSLLNSCCPSETPAEMMSPSTPIGIKTTIIAALGFSFFNPSAYLDTLIIIGGKSIFFPTDQRLIFGIGAVLASTFWFFALTYGASKLSLLFHSPNAWRILDSASGCLMIGIAVTMVFALL